MADEGDSKSLVLITRVGSTPTTGTNAKGPGLKSRGPFAVRRTEILSAQRCCKSKTRNRSSGFFISSGRYRTRTCDLLHVKQMLYQLS